VLAQAVLDLLHYLGSFSFLVFLAMSQYQREETLGRQGLFKKLCRLMAPSRVRQPLLGEITIEEVPSSVRSAPAWMASSRPTENSNDIQNCSDGLIVRMVGLSGELLWGPRAVPENIVLGDCHRLDYIDLRRLVSQDLCWPADSLTLVHSSEEVSLSDELDACSFGTNVLFYLIKSAPIEPGDEWPWCTYDEGVTKWPWCTYDQVTNGHEVQGVRYGPGLYQVTNDVTVGSGLSKFSQDLQELPAGALVRVSAVILVEEEDRVRGYVYQYTMEDVRMSGGLLARGRSACPCNGWISLADTGNSTWVLSVATVDELDYRV